MKDISLNPFQTLSQTQIDKEYHEKSWEGKNWTSETQSLFASSLSCPLSTKSITHISIILVTCYNKLFVYAIINFSYFAHLSTPPSLFPLASPFLVRAPSSPLVWSPSLELLITISRSANILEESRSTLE